MAADFDRTRLPSSQPSAPSDEQTRAFLQERLAYLGKVYAAIGGSFYLAGNLADAVSIPDYFARRIADPTTWIVPVAIGVYLVQWAVCRSGPRRLPTLRAVDAATTILTALCHSADSVCGDPGRTPRARIRACAAALYLRTAHPRDGHSEFAAADADPRIGGGMLSSCHESSLVHDPDADNDSPRHANALDVALVSWRSGHRDARFAHHLRLATTGARGLAARPVHAAREKIGEGGMGTVYRASHAMLRRPTAVKLLQADKAGAERLAHFEREVQLTSLLTHPNTVAVFDYGRTPDGVFYYAMEYLDGLNLEDLVRFDGPQPAARVVHIVRQVAGSLAEAHSIGLIHRDIKPANVILVAERGGVADAAKVVDFGLVEELDKDTAVTHEIGLAGTPHYVAPESISSPEDVGPQSDLYSLGCVAYYLLTGQTVFDGRTVVEVCSHHLHSLPLPPGERLGHHVPQTLSAIVMSCLEKNPERRPQSARALVDLLDRCHDVEPWTNELGRSWWTLHGPSALAQIRRERAAGTESRTRPALSVVGASILRPQKARRLA